MSVKEKVNSVARFVIDVVKNKKTDLVIPTWIQKSDLKSLGLENLKEEFDKIIMAESLPITFFQVEYKKQKFEGFGMEGGLLDQEEKIDVVQVILKRQEDGKIYRFEYGLHEKYFCFETN